MRERLVSRAPSIALLSLALAAAVHGLARATANRVALVALLGPRAWVAIGGLALALALVLAAVAREIAAARRDARRGREFAAERRGEPRARPLAPLALAFVAAIVAWGAFLALAQPFQRLWLDFALAGAAGGFALLLLVDRAIPPTLLRLATAACSVVLLLELALRATAALHPSPLLVRAGDAPRRLIERFLCRPGELRFGYPCNRGGFYDVEFFRKREGERRVASIGDSFNLGVVPHARNFTTVCERILGFQVDSFGVAGIGPPEYLRLLVDDALPLDPDAVVIGLFVGNDLDYPDVERDRPNQVLREWLARDRVLLCVAATRVMRIAAERRARDGPAAAVQGERSQPVRESDLDAAFPWLSDPSLEQATVSEETFLGLETQRALAICRGEPPSLASALDSIARAQRACAGRPFVVMLIPDEFQVEDALWPQVTARAGAALDRDWPQRVLARWLSEHGIACLDLLPILRAVEPMADGWRHLYHRRDTHFNARGNRVAGEALAKYLRELLRR